MQKPYYKHSRRTWYVELAGKQHSLGRHPDNSPEPKKPPRKGEWSPPAEVLSAYHRLMASRPDESLAPPSRDDTGSLVLLFERFLSWVGDHRKPATFEWYRWRIQEFVDHLKSRSLQSIAVADLKPLHLDEFLAAHPEWASGTKHGMARAAMRPLAWGVKKGHVASSPLAGYEKPKKGRRKLVVSPERFEEILKLTREPFRTLLVVTWETGCRPQESLAVEARHVDFDKKRWVFPPDESKGEQWPRVVYLTPKALEITRKLMEAYPEGKLFHNSDGVPWRTDAVNNAFIRLRVVLGMIEIERLKLVPPKLKRLRGADRKDEGKRAAQAVVARRAEIYQLAVKHGKKYSLYALRHSWATHALKRGVDALTVAILMGHRNPGTLASTYQHLSQEPTYLQGAAMRAAGVSQP